jgi:hypothetical protein
VSYRIKPYGLGRYDIGPFAKEFIYEEETDPTTNWTERPDLNEDLWTKRPDTTSETWIAVNNGVN